MPAPDQPVVPDPAASEVLPAAVLWDMDGTLVDTEPYWMAAEVALSAEHGGTWDENLALDLVGMSLEASAAELQARAGIRGTITEIVHELLARVVMQVRSNGVPWQPGARELLTAVREAGVPSALVTMSWKPLSDVVLAGIPAGTFDVVVTGDGVDQGKPHPEPYLRAASALGVHPSACVAIEDSLPGIASATAAGTRVLAVQAKVPVPPAPGRNRLASLEQVGLADLRRIAAGELYDLLPAG
ncbi:HAD family hydrolase [Ruania albidiflava]|uniref:HAD family hydrolase n=1 Tax=Ruania albidiflava TaxID=366586 RepID=UPI0023F4362F|nr:HAD family hydrolase [Ruania albidiflava]